MPIFCQFPVSLDPGFHSPQHHPEYEEHIYTPFPNGESLKDVEERIDNFIKDIKEKYKGKTIGIVAHRAPQLAFEVITKNISWEEANKNDWRKTGSWQPGWQYNID